ncbi:hypothetical protein S245_070244, partial [Arachis hypogaea]
NLLTNFFFGKIPNEGVLGAFGKNVGCHRIRMAKICGIQKLELLLSIWDIYGLGFCWVSSLILEL